jgi:hypothetical protein
MVLFSWWKPHTHIYYDLGFSFLISDIQEYDASTPKASGHIGFYKYCRAPTEVRAAFGIAVLTSSPPLLAFASDKRPP